MEKNRFCKTLSQLLLVSLMLLVASIPSFAANLNLKYEQVITDSYGNEIGYRTYKINNINELPAGSQWRNYLNTKMQSGKTIYEYASNICNSLSQDLNLTLSDRDSNSYTAKGNNGYVLNIYNYVNDFASDSSKTFLFMHEFGHVVMLNSYPRSYDFTNLDYGSDNRHYLDEILPNYNTAWVEGWANAFAAANNNGMVYSYDLKKDTSLAFLKENTFEQMSRNELFVAKVLYDSFKDIQGGQAAAYDVFARTSPHNSLEAFCKAYVKLYPQNKVALAKILVENSFGKITLKEILNYVNGGSYTVSSELYAFLNSSGLLNGTATTNYGTPHNTQTANTTTKTSFWSRIVSFFKGLFGKDEPKEVASSPKAPNTSVGSVASDEEIYNRYTDGTVSIARSVDAPEGAIAPTGCAVEGKNTVLSNGNASEFDGMAIAEVQELYFRYFNEYNELMADPNGNQALIKQAHDKMVAAKEQLKKLRKE